MIRYALGRRRSRRGSWSTSSSTPSSRRASPDSGHFLIRDHSTAAYGVVYPVLISPAWAFFKAIPAAYAAAKAINALMMSLAAIPAYLIARRMLSKPLAFAAAVLAVAIPSMVYTATLMTENAFYPIFLFAVYAIVVWLERPTVNTTLWVVALIGLAYLTRAQALSFGPAVLTAPLFYVWAQKRSWRALARLPAGCTASSSPAALLVIIVQVARGRVAARRSSARTRSRARRTTTSGRSSSGSGTRSASSTSRSASSRWRR